MRDLRLAAILVAAAVYLFLLRGYGFLLEDEGVLLSAFARTAAGERPYIDYPIVEGPGHYILGAWALDFFGGTVAGLRVGLAVLHLLSVTLLYALARTVAGRKSAWIAPALWLAFLPVVPGAFAAHNVPYALWSTNVLWLSVALALLRYARRGGRTPLAAAGLLSALAFWIRPESGGLAIVAAGWVGAGFSRRESRADHFVAFASVAIIAFSMWYAFGLRVWGADAAVHLLAVAGACFLYAGPVGASMPRDRHLRCRDAAAVLAVTFLVPTLHWGIPLAWRIGLGRFRSDVLAVGADAADMGYLAHPSITMTAGLFALALVAFAAAGRFLADRSIRPQPVLTAFAGVLIAAVLWSLATGLAPEGAMFSAGAQLENLSFVLAWMANFAGLAWVASAVRKPGPLSDRSLAVTALAPVAVAMYAQLYPRSDFLHQITAVPVTAVVAALLLETVVGWWGRACWLLPADGRRAVRRGIATVVGLAIVCELSVVLPGALSSYWGELPEGAANARVPVRIESGARDDLTAFGLAAAYVEQNTELGESVVAFPSTAGVTFAAVRPNALRADLWFGERPSKSSEAEQLAALEQNRPRLAVTLNDGWGKFLDAPARFADIAGLLREDYRLVARFGRYDVLARKDVAGLKDERFRPTGPAVAMIQARGAKRVQAARRFRNAMDLGETGALELPGSERDAVLFLRALRDGGDMRAAPVIAEALMRPRLSEALEARRAASMILSRHRAALERPAGDYPSAADRAAAAHSVPAFAAIDTVGRPDLERFVTALAELAGLAP